MTFQDFISKFPVQRPAGNGVNVICPAHQDRKASLSVTEGQGGKIVLHCHAGCSSREIVESLGISLKDLFPDEPKKKFKTPKHVAVSEPEAAKVKPTIDKIYSYTDVNGRELYQSVRLLPKDFRQRHRVGDKWVWNMTGVERVLYRLPEVVKASTVWIVEGEKDADNLAAHGFCATCNVGGAKKWLDPYKDVLAGKDIVICGDNDEPGQEHVELVYQSLAPVAKSIRRPVVPAPHKDISDLIAGKNGDGKKLVEELLANTVPHYGGVEMPIYNMAELEVMYHRQLEQSEKFQLDLGKWLPTLRNRLRPLVPGDVVLLLGDTGAGKTALLQNVARNAGGLMTLMFEIELPGERLYERHIAMSLNMTGRDVEAQYRSTKASFGEQTLMAKFPNFFVCTKPRLTLEQFETLIRRSELKLGEPAKLVLLDYVQLMRTKNTRSRYESTSEIAEEIKIIAKATNTIIVVGSQVQRRGGEDSKGITLTSGKDSGSLENSSGVVLSASRDPEDDSLLILRVLKATSGGAGTEVHCNYDGAKTLITERAQQPEPEQ